MTNLKTANIGMNKFCGPAVLSILTGRNTDDCAAVISKVNGQYNVTGVYMGDLLKAAERLGFKSWSEFRTGSLFRTLSTMAHHEGIYVVAIENHFVCIEVKDKKIYFCDNHTKEPIPAASSARLGQEVQQIAKVWKDPDYVEPVIPVRVEQVTEEFVQISNMVHLARHHKKHCIEPDCNISLTVLRQTVDRLFIYLLGNERVECEKLINETEWI